MSTPNVVLYNVQFCSLQDAISQDWNSMRNFFLLVCGYLISHLFAYSYSVDWISNVEKISPAFLEKTKQTKKFSLSCAGSNILHGAGSTRDSLCCWCDVQVGNKTASRPFVFRLANLTAPPTPNHPSPREKVLLKDRMGDFEKGGSFTHTLL